MSKASFEKTDLDVGAVNQMFSHLSRMHTSSSAAFFASCFAYLTYFGYYVLNIRRDVTEPIDDLVLLGVPFLASVFLALRYVSANTALKMRPRTSELARTLGTLPRQTNASIRRYTSIF